MCHIKYKTGAKAFFGMKKRMRFLTLTVLKCAMFHPTLLSLNKKANQLFGKYYFKNIKATKYYHLLKLFN